MLAKLLMGYALFVLGGSYVIGSTVAIVNAFETAGLGGSIAAGIVLSALPAVLIAILLQK